MLKYIVRNELKP